MKPMYFILAGLVLFSVIASFMGRSPAMIVTGNVMLACIPCFMMFKTLHYERGA